LVQVELAILQVHKQLQEMLQD
jgi:hypothetical protein